MSTYGANPAAPAAEVPGELADGEALGAGDGDDDGAVLADGAGLAATSNGKHQNRT